MSRNILADWRKRAELVVNEPFDAKSALQLVREIQDAARASRVGCRAVQAMRILKGLRRAENPSVRQLADARVAVSMLGKELEQTTLH